jgi:predicted O-methyltransferase YrrM
VVNSYKYSRIPINPTNNIKKEILNTILVSGLLIPKIVIASDINFMEKYSYSQPSDILQYIYDTAEEGNINSVLKAMDKFATVYPMYKLSPEKVNFLNNEIVNTRSQNILELGTFFGYSALNIAKSMTQSSILTTIEGNILNFEVANNIIDYALKYNPELRKRVQIIQMNSDKYLESSVNNKKVDFVYFDHDKNCYLRDIEFIYKTNLLDTIAIVVADNVIYPGAPGFLEFVETKYGVDNTVIKYFPFERIGFETNFKKVKDGMSVTKIQKQS